MNSFWESYALPILLVFLLSVGGVLFLLYGKDKIKDQFTRTYMKYKASDYFKKFEEEIKSREIQTNFTTDKADIICDSTTDKQVNSQKKETKKSKNVEQRSKEKK